MDNPCKQFLLCSVIDYAKQFSRSRQRPSGRLTSRDIEQALYCLGLRPLYSSLELNGDEVVADLGEFAFSEYKKNSTTESNSICPFTLSVFPLSTWVPTLDSRDNFKRRKCAISGPTSFRISPQSKAYIDAIIKGPEPALSIIPPTDVDPFLAVWFLGLHFSNIVNTQSPDWSFVRKCLLFLDQAITNYSQMTHRPNENNAFVRFSDNRTLPEYLFTTWRAGMERIISGKAGDESACVVTDSPQQTKLIQAACRLYMTT